MIMHSIYQVNSNKQLEYTDIVKFAWDKKEELVDKSRLMNLDEATNFINRLVPVTNEQLNINNNGK